jgi:hypothetical protein
MLLWSYGSHWIAWEQRKTAPVPAKNHTTDVLLTYLTALSTHLYTECPKMYKYFSRKYEYEGKRHVVPAKRHVVMSMLTFLNNKQDLQYPPKLKCTGRMWCVLEQQPNSVLHISEGQPYGREALCTEQDLWYGNSGSHCMLKIEFSNTVS